MIKQIEKLIERCDWEKALSAALGEYSAERSEEAARLLVWIYRMKGDASSALFYCGKLPDGPERLCEEAVLFRMKCDFASARNRAKRAMRIFEHSGDTEGLSYALWTLGGIERYGGRPLAGYRGFKKALPISKPGAPRAYALCGVGGTSRLLGKTAESLKSYKAANGYFKKIGDRFGLAYSCCGLGSAYRMMKKFGISKKYYEKAITIYKKIKDEWNGAYSAWGLAQTEWFLGSKKKASRKNEAAMKTFKKYRDPRGVFYCLLQEANFSRMSGNFKAAQNLLDKSSKALSAAGLRLLYEERLIKKQNRLISSHKTAGLLIP